MGKARPRHAPEPGFSVDKAFSIHPDGLIDKQSVLLHLLVKRRAINIENPSPFPDDSSSTPEEPG